MIPDDLYDALRASHDEDRDCDYCYPKETPMTDPKTITWREWKDYRNRPLRETREGHVDRLSSSRFASIPLWASGFSDDVVSVTVTIPAPEWAEDRWVLAVNKGGFVYVYRLREGTWTRLDEYTVIPLPESVQDALDEAVAR